MLFLRLLPFTLPLLALFGLRPEEIVEHYEDGSVRLQYHVDAEGRKHGAYKEWRENGELLHVLNYRKDVLHGRYETFYEDGEAHIVAKYQDGLLDGNYVVHIPERDEVRTFPYDKGARHGKAKVKVGKKIVWRQTWKHDALVKLDGIEPFPRDVHELRSELAVILEAPEELPGKGDDPKRADRYAALRRLQAYRHLCGLRYDDMELVDDWNELCDAASTVCRMNGEIDHYPPKPAGCEDELYKKGARGARSSNLSMGPSMEGSVDSYMDDSDASNIDRVGHRRWCLNPAMKRTGFGADERFSAMWSMDSSGGGAKGIDAILYPPPGWVPVDFFGERHAWGITPIRGSISRPDDLVATVRELDEDWVPKGEPLELDYKNV
ncbi:MAG: hypothetical protein AAF368_04515, partial [Planctomycetota bacterium]